MKKHKNFCERVFSSSELIQLESKKFKIESVAGGFCAKEAFLKAIRIGISGVNLQDIEILKDKKGAPYIRLQEKIISRFHLENFNFSVTHFFHKFYL